MDLTYEKRDLTYEKRDLTYEKRDLTYENGILRTSLDSSRFFGVAERSADICLRTSLLRERSADIFLRTS